MGAQPSDGVYARVGGHPVILTFPVAAVRTAGSCVSGFRLSLPRIKSGVAQPMASIKGLTPLDT